MADHVVVIGAGVAGLAAALALGAKDFRVTILDRDEALPEGLQPADSWTWARNGAPQVRQPHFLMGRLRNLLHQYYPDLIEDLFAAGVWELPFAETIHPAARQAYRPRAEDEEMTPLCARRTTFEMVLRNFIERRAIAQIRSGCRVEDLIIEESEGTPRVTGCRVVIEGAAQDIEADIIIDASGRGSNLVTRLRTAGIAIKEDLHKSETMYSTRHYRLREGQEYPQLTGLPGVDFSDFTLGALPADNGTLTVTLAVWKDDPVLSRLAKDADAFDEICQQVAKIRPWIDPARVEPLSGVISFANMDYLWRYMVEEGEPRILNFFLAGDSVIRTNPKFGRGCTWATVAVHRLVEILASDPDPRSRAVRYDSALWDEFREDWETMFNIERKSREKFASEIGKSTKSLGLWLATRIESHIMNVAIMADAQVQRAVMRGYHGLDGMSDWVRDPKIWLRIAMSARPSARMKALKRANAGRPSRAQLEAMARD